MDPLVFTPYYRPQIWGGRRLAERLGKRLPDEGRFGEAWEISAQSLHVSRVAEGPLAGTLLTDLCTQHARELLGEKGDRYHLPERPEGCFAHMAPVPFFPAEFPLLIKYLDCQDQLSIQVHPTDALARHFGVGNLGKTEAWVVLHAEPEGRIYAGLRPGVTRAELERRLDDGTAAACLHSFAPRPGDCVFLPAGTVHAVGGGVLMAEVQQSSDATFRLFDWNRVGPDGRPRQLHATEALAAIDWSAGPVAPVVPAALSGLPAGVRGERLVACDYFTMERYTLGAALAHPHCGRLSIGMVLEGEVAISVGSTGYRRTFRSGETLLIPGASAPADWTPLGGPSTLLLTAT